MSSFVPASQALRAPFKSLPTITPQIHLTECSNGEILMESPIAAGVVEKSIIEYLHKWSAARPNTVMIAQRDSSSDWCTLSYRQMHEQVHSLAQALIDLGLEEGERILILSENSIEQAVLSLAAMTIGVVIVPLSAAYSQSNALLQRLLDIVSLIKPSMIFIQDANAYASTLEAITSANLAPKHIMAVHQGSSLATGPNYDFCVNTKATESVLDRYAKTGPDTVGKILFTSGSTGLPKGVITTQRMLCKNMAMQDAFWLGDENTEPYVTLNWMPWNHTMAGNGLFNRSLRQGGTYYIDDGKPTPSEYHKTLRNLKDICPHSHSDVPAGFSIIADALEADSSLNQKFFSRLKFLQYAGATLPDELWQRLQVLSVKATGQRTPFLTGYGFTEAGPLITQLYWPVEGGGIIGLPAPGVEAKLLPIEGGRYEIRVRGENITPGYYENPEATAKAFDGEKYYITGDSVTFVDRHKPVDGLRFSTRVTEDFKLQTGTFVQVGMVRAQVLGSMMPLMSDFVITGENREFVGALAWLNIPACRKFLGDDREALSFEEMVRDPKLISALKEKLSDYNAKHPASSTRIQRLMILKTPASIEAGEMTEKGYINQRRVLDQRFDQVSQLYGKSALSLPEVLSDPS